MNVETNTQLKQRFLPGKEVENQDMYALIDSMRNKGEKIPIIDVNGLDQLAAGSAGKATPGGTPVATDKFMKYEVDQAGIYSGWGGIEVTSEDLAGNIVQIWGMPGNWELNIKPLPLAGVVTKSTLSEVVNGEIASSLTAELSKGFIGGTTGYNDVGAGGYYFNSLQSKFVNRSVLKRLELVAHKAGPIQIVVGSWSGAGFSERVNLGEFIISEIDAVTTLEFPNVEILPGEYVAVKGVLVFNYPKFALNDGSGNFQPGNRYTQTSSTTLLGQLPLGSFMMLNYFYSETPSVLADTFVQRASFENELRNEAMRNGGSRGAVLYGFGTDYNDGTPAYPSVEGYYMNDNQVPANGKVGAVTFNAPSTGTLPLVIGNVDQFGVFKEGKQINVSVVSGINTIELNEDIKAGQTVAVKLPNNCGLRANTAGMGNYKGTASGYGGVMVTNNAGYLSYTFTFLEQYETSFATRSELNNVNNAIASIQGDKPVFLYTPDGRRVRLSVDNDLNLSVSASEYSQVLVLGNSITLHGIQPYWWGLYGMAASERSKDFVHRLQAKMGGSSTIGIRAENIATWELSHAGYDLTTFDGFFAEGPDLIVIRLGENVGTMAGYQASLVSLINYCKSKAHNANIVVTGVFWTDAAKDAAQQAAALATGCAYVPLAQLDFPENKSYMGAVVMGDDDNTHIVNNSGVANHPGDLGHDRIADAIFAVL